AINQLSPVAKDALSGAEPGDIIGPIETGGFTIIYKVMEKGRVGTQSLDEARDEITRILEEQSRQEAFEHWLRMIMAEHFIGMYL
ncbi:MAG: peptidylprolyl isomerase, partial [Desulfomonilia bacterium]|nr:peptidylprolyl isomerase [Desulfomonilia bacterium]